MVVLGWCWYLGGSFKGYVYFGSIFSHVGEFDVLVCMGEFNKACIHLDVVDTIYIWWSAYGVCMFLVGFHWLWMHVMYVREVLCVDSILAIMVSGCSLKCVGGMVTMIWM